MLLEFALLCFAVDLDRPAPLVRDPNAPVMLGQKAKSKSLKAQPGATVEVNEAAGAEEMRTFVKWMAPALKSSAREGEVNGGTAQMLAEFMAQDPSKPRPPTVPAYWTNAQRPARRGFGVSAK